MAKKTVKIVDSTFAHNRTIGLAGQNAGILPEMFAWDFTAGPAKAKVFTDLRLEEAINDSAEKKIGLLLEPRCLAPLTYRRAKALAHHFDVILTHDRQLLDIGEPFKFYPFGGNWLKRWGIFNKTRNFSILVGKKNDLPGHRLRHRIAERFGNTVDVYGEPYTDYLPDKTPALRPYRFSIIVENCKADYWFTEKIVDCISQGTIPIYWGCPSIGNFFQINGILTFDKIRDLSEILSSVNRATYERMLGTAIVNLAIAHSYACPEDWIAQEYPGIFDYAR